MQSRALLVALLALALLAPAAAQPPTFSERYQVRVGSGDIPTTAAHEPAGWSVEQRYTFEHPEGAQDVAFMLPAGARVVAATCTCGNGTEDAGRYLFHVSGPAGSHTATVTTTQPAAAALALNLAALDASSVAIVYAPVGLQASGPVAATSPGTSTDGSSTIQVFPGLPATFWLAVNPAPAATVVTPAPAGIPWLWLLGGLLAGALVWSILVAQGFVQARSRKQVAAVAAHEVAAAEPAPVLEARKRALMAALKELELAKMGNEMDAATYDVVKADLKRQAVTVMRALETSKAS